MNGVLGNLQFSLMVWLGLALVVKAAGAALLPILLERYRRITPGPRGLWLLAWAVAPVLLPALGVLLLFAPSLLTLLGVPVDHCHVHGGGHLHLCLLHPPEPVRDGLPLVFSLAALGVLSLHGVHFARMASLTLKMASMLGANKEDTGKGYTELNLADPLAFCLGWLRPRIFMSCGMLRRLNSSELGVVMAHEQSHARRRDALRLALASSLSLMYGRKLRALLLSELALAVEQACDEAAATACGDSLSVAETLLRVERLGTATLPESVISFGGNRSAERIVYLLEPAAPVLSTPLRVAAVVLAAVFLLILASNLDSYHHGIESLLHHLIG
ncbi:hypothetical protein DJ031_12915 [bacterium endosymbiont of Escarpia laminata]|nr:MAG: hypothetical protein DJ031_12915 [bacterium endosymbiont of Escarpia laminata]